MVAVAGLADRNLCHTPLPVHSPGYNPRSTRALREVWPFGRRFCKAIPDRVDVDLIHEVGNIRVVADGTNVHLGAGPSCPAGF